MVRRIDGHHLPDRRHGFHYQRNAGYDLQGFGAVERTLVRANGMGNVRYGAWSYDGTMSLHQLTALALAQTVSTVSFKTAVSGDDILTGTVIWTKLDIASAGTNQNVSISYTGMGTGALTQTS